MIFQDNVICHCENDRGALTFKKNICLNCHGGGQDHFDKSYYDLGEHNYEDDILSEPLQTSNTQCFDSIDLQIDANKGIELMNRQTHYT